LIQVESMSGFFFQVFHLIVFLIYNQKKKDRKLLQNGTRMSNEDNAIETEQKNAILEETKGSQNNDNHFRNTSNGNPITYDVNNPLKTNVIFHNRAMYSKQKMTEWKIHKLKQVCKLLEMENGTALLKQIWDKFVNQSHYIMMSDTDTLSNLIVGLLSELYALHKKETNILEHWLTAKMILESLRDYKCFERYNVKKKSATNTLPSVQKNMILELYQRTEFDKADYIQLNVLLRNYLKSKYDIA